MLLIATDEAGYGPKLGPLVIAGTAWKIPGDGIVNRDGLAQRFAPLRDRHFCGEQTVVVDDSKSVYSPSSGLASLHAAVSASLHWCGRTEPTLSQWLPLLSPHDFDSIGRAPWLEMLDGPDFLDASSTTDLRARWRESDIELADVQARIITAEAFNTACANCNKADLLSESTLGLVRWLIQRQPGKHNCVAVYCDRHGGRRYYAGVLQHVFPEAHVQVVAESKQQSVYRLATEESRIDIHFTVKGDSFTPVALASMHAKYLRERFMDSFNAYFAARHREPTPLKPTAGYPVDADRFLKEIEPLIQREKIDPQRLVRSR